MDMSTSWLLYGPPPPNQHSAPRGLDGAPILLKRYFVVVMFGHSRCSGRRRWLAARRALGRFSRFRLGWLVSLAALGFCADELQFGGCYFQRRAFVAVAVGEFLQAHTAFEVDRFAFRQVLTRHFREPAPARDAEPCGDFFVFAVILAALGGGHGELANGCALRCKLQLGIAA